MVNPALPAFGAIYDQTVRSVQSVLLLLLHSHSEQRHSSVVAALSNSLLFEYSIEYLIEYSSITITNVTFRYCYSRGATRHRAQSK